MMINRAVVPFELKALGEAGELEGYGAVFGNVDAWGDVILPGAFARTIRAAEKSGRMPPMLWQHDQRTPIGVWDQLREDDKGLHVTGRLADTAIGRDARTLLAMGALTGLSIGFQTVKARPRKEDESIRELLEIKLWEVSPVTFPANDEARVTGVKGGLELSVREFERFLVETGGFSQEHAQAVIAKGYRALKREVEGSEGSAFANTGGVGEALEELLATINRRG